MSKTIRRKNDNFSSDYAWFRDIEKRLIEDELRGYPYRSTRESRLAWAGCSPDKDIGQVMLKKHFHSDSFNVMNNPGWYINQFYTRRLRVQNRAQLRNAVKLVNRDDLEDVEVTSDRYLPYYW